MQFFTARKSKAGYQRDSSAKREVAAANTYATMRERSQPSPSPRISPSMISSPYTRTTAFGPSPIENGVLSSLRTAACFDHRRRRREFATATARMHLRRDPHYDGESGQGIKSDNRLRRRKGWEYSKRAQWLELARTLKCRRQCKTRGQLLGRL